MTLLKIAQIGHPILRQRAQPVGLVDDPDLQRLLDDMILTMRDAGGIGLAAPQVYRSLRAIVALPILAREAPRAEVEPLVLLDPVLELDDTSTVDGLEGCLSIPGLRGIVPRAPKLRWSGRDRAGRPIEGEAAGLFARVLQHEVDHLDGILFLSRMIDPSLLAVPSETDHLMGLLEIEGPTA